jgi:hypothetical protein
MNEQLTEYQLRDLLVESAGVESNDTVWSIVDQLMHRISYEGLPGERAVALGCKWLENKSKWKQWVYDHDGCEFTTLPNGWVRSVSTKYDEHFVRTCMQPHLCRLLDTLQELMPLPHHADKVSRVFGWLDTARDSGLLTLNEEFELRHRLVQHFF